MEELFTTTNLVAFLTLTVLEIVLGIDNVIFIAILSGKLPAAQQQRARTLGIALAVISRVLLLLAIRWIMGLTAPLFTILDNTISGRDLILVGGGLFLLTKATLEIHDSLEGSEESDLAGGAASMGMALVQIALLDIVFSLDSVITAVGLVEQVSIMAIAIVLAVVVMLMAAKSIGDFVDANPTIKILALSFLILVGVTLMAEGFDVHVPKGYIYFAMAFSVTVEMLNIRMRTKRTAPIKLHNRYAVNRGQGDARPGDPTGQG